MKARIISKSHFVSKVVTEYSVNGQVRQHVNTVVTRKPEAACTGQADRMVFRAIHLLKSHKWEDLYNHFFDTCVIDSVPGLTEAIDRHGI